MRRIPFLFALIVHVAASDHGLEEFSTRVSSTDSLRVEPNFYVGVRPVR